MQLSSPEDPRSSAHQGLAGVIGCGYPVSALLIRRRHKRLIIAVVKRVGCWNPQNRSTLNENALSLQFEAACGVQQPERFTPRLPGRSWRLVVAFATSRSLLASPLPS